jgi:hypothetical protein
MQPKERSPNSLAQPIRRRPHRLSLFRAPHPPPRPHAAADGGGVTRLPMRLDDRELSGGALFGLDTSSEACMSPLLLLSASAQHRPVLMIHSLVEKEALVGLFSPRSTLESGLKGFHRRSH